MNAFDVGTMLDVVKALYELVHNSTDADIPDETRSEFAYAFTTYEPELIRMELGASGSTAGKLAAFLSKGPCKYSDIADLCKEFGSRLIDETSLKKYFSLTTAEAGHFSSPRKGWEKVIERFADTVDDIEEASKCYALSRYPACVFHSVQIVEHGLIELGKFLDVKDPLSGWTAVANALEATIKRKYQDRSAFERENFQFLEQVQGTVAGLKNAWRNKISHAHGRLVLMSGEFNPDTAVEILYATRSFMRRLADDLPR
jgi:hypothetical protein